MKIVKNTIIIAVLIAIGIGMCSCADIYDKEYVSVNDYVMTDSSAISGDRVNVNNLSELKTAIRTLVSNAETEGQILFSEDYVGEPSEDMADACWQVRTQDALCAYCVDNISYEISKIVSYYEATVSVSYSDKGVPFEKIIRLQYSFGIDDVILDMIDKGIQRSAVLVNSSYLNAADIEEYVKRDYEKDPIVCPIRPRANVNLFNGTNTQKLYEINLSYDMAPEELEKKKTSLRSFNPFDEGISALSEYKKANEALSFYDGSVYKSGRNSVYDALILNAADSEGLALGYVAMCKKLGLDCMIVEGQYNFATHFWNMVKIDGNYYHIDPANYITDGYSGWFMNDTDAWGRYRWDTSTYPTCSGILLID